MSRTTPFCAALLLAFSAIQLNAIANDCCVCPPKWSVRAGALFLERSRPDSGLLAFELGGPPPELIRAQDFDFDTRAGAEISIIRHSILRSQTDLEVRYFGVDSWTATTPSTPSTNPVFNYATPFFFAPPGTAISGSYHSELQNVEVNFRRHFHNWLQILAGMRYVQLDERLEMIQTVGGGPFVASTDTKNELIGAQFGADILMLQRGRVGLETLLKAGIYNNSAKSHSTATNAGAPVIPGSNASDDDVAFIGELGITGTYQFTNSLSLRGGYQILWTEGIATASEQIPISDPVAGSASIALTDSPFYTGGFVNLQFQY